MRYSPDDLRAIWVFVQHDFERFLELLAWLETLADPERDEQLEAARHCAVAKGALNA
jgi:hypothetical protein